MKWIDDREELYLEFNDNQKAKMLSTILQNDVEKIVGEAYNTSSDLNYYQMLGAPFWNFNRPYQHLRDSIQKCQSTEGLIANFIAFHNPDRVKWSGYSFQTVGVVSDDPNARKAYVIALR